MQTATRIGVFGSSLTSKWKFPVASGSVHCCTFVPVSSKMQMRADGGAADAGLSRPRITLADGPCKGKSITLPVTARNWGLLEYPLIWAYIRTFFPQNVRAIPLKSASPSCMSALSVLFPNSAKMLPDTMDEESGTRGRTVKSNGSFRGTKKCPPATIRNAIAAPPPNCTFHPICCPLT